MIVFSALALAFGYSINDFYDSKFDKLKPDTKNVITLGLIGRREAALFSSALLLWLPISFFILPQGAFISIALLYIFFILYSCPPFRFKEKIFLDVVTHGTIMPVLFLGSYMLSSIFGPEAFLVGVCIFIMSCIVCMTQEIRDIKPDKKAGFRTTVPFLGYKRSLNIIQVLFSMAVAIFLFTVVYFLPIYTIIFLFPSILYFKVIFSKPKQGYLYDMSTRSWDQITFSLAIIGLLILPFYLGLV